MDVFLQEKDGEIKDLIIHVLHMGGHVVYMSDAKNPAFKVIAANPNIRFAIVDIGLGLEPLVALAEIGRGRKQMLCFLYGQIDVPSLTSILNKLDAKIICKTEIVTCLRQEGII